MIYLARPMWRVFLYPKGGAFIAANRSLSATSTPRCRSWSRICGNLPPAPFPKSTRWPNRSTRSVPFTPLTRYGRDKAACTAPEPQGERPCAPGVLQLWLRQLYSSGRRGRVRLPADHFLFPALQVVPRCCPAPWQRTVCRSLRPGGQAVLWSVRRVLCFKLKQRQILPGLPKANTAVDKPQNASGNSGYCHAVGAIKPLCNGVFWAWKSSGKGLIPFPSK